MKSFVKRTVVILCVVAAAFVTINAAPDLVKLANGTISGTGRQPSGVRIFKGVPFGQPPVGDLRWREPQPVKNWTGVRAADQFGPRCMQAPVFGDMGFRAPSMSEDCLYLNVWTPAKTGNEHLPVLVYFYGGGFVAGDGSEPRYDGESMAAKGIVAVTVNYRLGVFGFFAHPELTQESPHKASGNYALLDQYAALVWVQQNIAAFGGDPKQVTIAGESAGSVSVSAQMASPLSKDLIAGAIGESGSILGTLSAVPLAKGEEAGVQFANSIGAHSLAELRALDTQKIFGPATQGGFTSVGRFAITVDGYFFPESPSAIFAAGKQAHVPLLVGWNSEELSGQFLLQGKEPTPENFQAAVKLAYGPRTDEVLKLYSGSTRDEILDAATALAGDRFIAYSTWKWAEVHQKTGASPVFRYYFARPRPAMKATMGNATPGLAGGVVRNSTAPPPPPARGAVHSAEIEYALGNLKTNPVYEWTADDYKVSQVMQAYFANFIKKRNPNGGDLPTWPAIASPTGRGPEREQAGLLSALQVMRIDVKTAAEPDKTRARYLFQDQVLGVQP
jgi:para-nitrobenzyl esterase